MTIAAILSTKGGEVATVPAGTRVRDAVVLLRDRKIGAVPVIDGARSSASSPNATWSAACARMAPPRSTWRSTPG